MKAGWKDIAVVVGPEPASEPAVAMAGRLALTHGAVLTGLRLLPHAPGGPEDGFARGAAVKDVIARRRSADEAIARGAFGSPTIYLDKTDMYFGNDRLPLIHAKLIEKKAVA